MIIVCPTCARKYSVKIESLGDGKMVRCSACGTTWQQDPEYIKKNDVAKKNIRINSKFGWIFFLIVSISSVVFLIFSTTYLQNIPYYLEYMTNAYIKKNTNMNSQFDLYGVSHYFIKKNDGLYVSITGNIKNVSDKQLDAPYLSINLRTQKSDGSIDYGNDDTFINETWAEKLDIKKIDSGKNVVFETALKRVPKHNLVCDIKISDGL